jgi:hypothetical protein
MARRTSLMQFVWWLLPLLAALFILAVAAKGITHE